MLSVSSCADLLAAVQQLGAHLIAVCTGSVPVSYTHLNAQPLYVNAAYRQMFGTPAADFKAAMEAVHPQDRPALQSALAQLRDQHGALQHSFRVWDAARKTYRFIRIDASIRTLPQTGAVLVALLQDVSEQFTLQTQLNTANQKISVTL